MTSGTSLPGDNFVIYLSATGNMWTTSASIANFLGLATQITVSAYTLTSAAGGAATFADAAYFNGRSVYPPLPLRAGASTAGTGIIFNSNDYGTGVYVCASTGLWTSSGSIAAKLGYQEVKIDLSSATIHTTSAAITDIVGTYVTTTTIIAANFGATGASLPAASVISAGIYTNADKTMWTSDVTIAGRLQWSEVTIDIGGLTTWGQVLTKFQSDYGPTLTTAKRVTHVGDDATDAAEKTGAAILGIGSGTFGGEITDFDNDYTTIASNIDTALAAAGLTVTGSKLVKNTYGPDAAGITAILTAIDAELAGLGTRIGSRALNATEIATISANIPSSITYAEGAGMTEIIQGAIDNSKQITQVAARGDSRASFTYQALASAINGNADSQFWAMVQTISEGDETYETVYIFTKNGGNFDDLLACDVSGSDDESRSSLSAISFENLETGGRNQSGTVFSLGGLHWGTMKPLQSKENLGNQVWNVTLNGLDVGAERDLQIANAGEIETPNLTDGIINGMDRNSFVEIQNAANGPWSGAEVRTQSAAQEALDAITEAINTKDKIRADLGALQNRLENTMTNLTVQAENLQASESRISDVDVATEMTEFTRNNVLSQAATSMLAQANSLSQLALSLIR
jgi:flagellin-like hook-associated protein FlgL